MIAVRILDPMPSLNQFHLKSRALPYLAQSRCRAVSSGAILPDPRQCSVLARVASARPLPAAP
jgi:hypothetical protein